MKYTLTGWRRLTDGSPRPQYRLGRTPRADRQLMTFTAQLGTSDSMPGNIALASCHPRAAGRAASQSPLNRSSVDVDRMANPIA